MKPPNLPTLEQLKRIQAPLQVTRTVNVELEKLLDTAGIAYTLHRKTDVAYLEVNASAYAALNEALVWVRNYMMGASNYDFRTSLLPRLADTPAYIELILRLLSIKPWNEERVKMLRAELILICQKEPEEPK